MKISGTVVSIVLGCVLLSGFGYAQQRHFYVFACEDLPSGTSLSASITLWEGDNRIRIADDASALIGNEFCGQAASIRQYMEKRKFDPPRQDEFLDWLIQSYLYELRDRTLWAGNRARSFGDNGRTIRNVSFQRQPDSGKQIIGVPQVDKFPVALFLASLAPVFHGDNGQGHLYVTSTPDRSSIEIDNTERGETCKKFVLTAGHHAVSVVSEDGKLSCKHDVEIRDGKTEHFSCPEKTDCPKK